MVINEFLLTIFPDLSGYQMTHCFICIYRCGKYDHGKNYRRATLSWWTRYVLISGHWTKQTPKTQIKHSNFEENWKLNTKIYLKIIEIASTTNENKILVDDQLIWYSSRAAKVFHLVWPAELVITWWWPVVLVCPTSRWRQPFLRVQLKRSISRFLVMRTTCDQYLGIHVSKSHSLGIDLSGDWLDFIASSRPSPVALLVCAYAYAAVRTHMRLRIQMNIITPIPKFCSTFPQISTQQNAQWNNSNTPKWTRFKSSNTNVTYLTIMRFKRHVPPNFRAYILDTTMS